MRWLRRLWSRLRPAQPAGPPVVVDMDQIILESAYLEPELSLEWLSPPVGADMKILWVEDDLYPWVPEQAVREYVGPPLSYNQVYYPPELKEFVAEEILNGT